MADLIQFQEDGFQTPSGVDWIRGSACIVTGANRRRILDRDNYHGHEDGWTYHRRAMEDGGTAVTRIRWDNTYLYTRDDLDKHMKGWNA